MYIHRLLPLVLVFSAKVFADQPKPAFDDGPCEVITRFAKSRLLLEKEPEKGPKVDFTCSLPQDVDLNFMIATVPNPIETHLALWFDRQMESIINAAGSVGFRFEEAWIPWNADLVRDEPDPDKKKALEAERRLRERQPGVLLFRASHICRTPGVDCQYHDLVVLLVPETPTAGIQQEVFSSAAKIIFWTSRPFNTLKDAHIPVMGPSFSGSFPSLAKIMHGLKEVQNRMTAISGSSANPGAWKEAFDDFPRSTYQTTVHSLSTQLQALKQHLITGGKQDSRIALLTETETALGWSYTIPAVTGAFSDLPPPLVFRYPRAISRLRNAYGDEVLRAVVGAQPQPASFRNLLAFRLFDIGFGSDSSPVLAKSQTPLSQDAVLLEIARSLERERITLAGILATDVFDGLFLARYLRDACPDVRLFTLDSDLLYERAEEDYPFDGILALGPYPLIASNQTWTNGTDDQGQANDDTHKPAFSSYSNREAEGIYNATRALLISANYVSSDPQTKPPLTEYFNPTDDCVHLPKPNGCSMPPIWLTVVGRSGYWPVALMDAPANRDPVLSWGSPYNKPRFGMGPIPRVWRMLFVLLTLVIGWYFVRNVRAVKTTNGRVGASSHLTIWPHEDGWAARLCYSFVCSVSLLATYALFVTPLLAVARSGFGPDTQTALVWLGGLLLVVFAFFGFAPLLVFVRWARPAKRRDAAGRTAKEVWPETWHFAILIMAALFAMFFLWVVLNLFVFPLRPSAPDHFERMVAFFFAFRSLHVTSGVSPMVPLLILLPGYFLWGRVHLRRVTMRHERLVDVPPLAGKEAGPLTENSALAKCREAVDFYINEPLPLHWRTAGSFVLVFAINLYMTRALRSFEQKLFDTTFLIMLSVLYALIFLTYTRFLMVWRQFRMFLEQLERLPLRFGFESLPKCRGISPLFQFTPPHSEFRMFVGIRERLARLKLQEEFNLSCPVAIRDLDAEIGATLTRVTQGSRISRADAQPLRRSLAKVNQSLLDDLNASFWKSGRPQTDKNPAEGSNVSANSSDALREEVIALQYQDYIQYVLHQQRNLLMFSVSAFLLTVFALHAYPFEGPRIITTFITVVFISFACGVVTVLASAERDPILSRITKTEAGKLSGGFYGKVAAYLGVPTITVLSSQFPSWGRFLFSWIQPLLEAIK